MGNFIKVTRSADEILALALAEQPCAVACKALEELILKSELERSLLIEIWFRVLGIQDAKNYVDQFTSCLLASDNTNQNEPLPTPACLEIASVITVLAESVVAKGIGNIPTPNYWRLALALSVVFLCSQTWDLTEGNSNRRLSALESLTKLCCLPCFPLQALVKGFEKESFANLAINPSSVLRGWSCVASVGSACGKCMECRFVRGTDSSTTVGDACWTCGTKGVAYVTEIRPKQLPLPNVELHIQQRSKASFVSSRLVIEDLLPLIVESGADSAWLSSISAVNDQPIKLPDGAARTIRAIHGGWLANCFWDGEVRGAAARLLLAATNTALRGSKPFAAELRFGCHLSLVNTLVNLAPNDPTQPLLCEVRQAVHRLAQVAVICSLHAPLKDGGARKLVRLLRCGTSQHILPCVLGVLVGVKYGDLKAVKVAVQALIVGPGTALKERALDSTVPLPHYFPQSLRLSTLLKSHQTEITITSTGQGVTVAMQPPHDWQDEQLQRFLEVHLSALFLLGRENALMIREAVDIGNIMQSGDEMLGPLGWSSVLLGAARKEFPTHWRHWLCRSSPSCMVFTSKASTRN